MSQNFSYLHSDINTIVQSLDDDNMSLSIGQVDVFSRICVDLIRFKTNIQGHSHATCIYWRRQKYRWVNVGQCGTMVIQGHAHTILIQWFVCLSVTSQQQRLSQGFLQTQTLYIQLSIYKYKTNRLVNPWLEFQTQTECCTISSVQ